MKTYFLSFCTDEEFLGATIIDLSAEDYAAGESALWAAIRKPRALNANPGGHVMLQHIPNNMPPSFKNRLLSEEEVHELNSMPRTQ